MTYCHKRDQPHAEVAPAEPGDAPPGHYLRNKTMLVAKLEQVDLLTRSPGHNTGTAERHPTPLRPGALDFRRWPSLRDGHRIYPDGSQVPVSTSTSPAPAHAGQSTTEEP